MARLSRRELKRDEVRETFSKGVAFVSEHRRGTFELMVILASVAAVVGVFLGIKHYREDKASDALSRGLGVLDAPLFGDSNASPDMKAYASDAERRAEARKFFERAAGYRGTDAARAAKVLLASEDAGSGKTADAERALQSMASGHLESISGIAEIDRARLLALQGKAEEAILTLKRAVDSPDTKAPKDALLSELSSIAEAAGRGDEARRALQRLVDEYPQSPYVQDARQKLTTM